MKLEVGRIVGMGVHESRVQLGDDFLKNLAEDLGKIFQSEETPFLLDVREIRNGKELKPQDDWWIRLTNQPYDSIPQRFGKIGENGLFEVRGLHHFVAVCQSDHDLNYCGKLAISLKMFHPDERVGEICRKERAARLVWLATKPHWERIEQYHQDFQRQWLDEFAVEEYCQ